MNKTDNRLYSFSGFQAKELKKSLDTKEEINTYSSKDLEDARVMGVIALIAFGAFLCMGTLFMLCGAMPLAAVVCALPYLLISGVCAALYLREVIPRLIDNPKTSQKSIELKQTFYKKTLQTH